MSKIDLQAVAKALVAAADHAATLPYRVEFRVDEKNGLLLADATAAEGLRVDGAVTGRPLAAIFETPENEFKQMFGFLEASAVGRK